MTASVNDKFKKVGVAGTLTTLASPGKALAAASLNGNSLTNWPTETGIIFAIRTVDDDGVYVSGTYTEWYGTVSGNTISNLTLAYGTDQVYAAGANVQLYIPLSAKNHNDFVDGLTQDHDQSGYHSKALNDANGAAWLTPSATASAVNSIQLANAAASGRPTFSAIGSDTNISIGYETKGTGEHRFVGKVRKVGDQDGWNEIIQTLAYSAYDADTRQLTLTVSGEDVTTMLSPGTRLEITQATDGTKHGIVVASSFSSDTTIEVFMHEDNGTTYNEAITSPRYSREYAPYGLDLDPTKWTLETEMTTQRSTSNTSVTGLTDDLDVGVGAWIVSLQTQTTLEVTSGVTRFGLVSLSTDGGSTETDADLTGGTSGFSGASTREVFSNMYIQARKMLAAKTTYTLAGRVNGSSSTVKVNRAGTSYIRAVCAYV